MISHADSYQRQKFQTKTMLQISAKQTLTGALVLLSFTSCNSSPSQEIVGSYFPAWMLCAASGIGIAIFTHLILLKSDIDRHIPAKLFIYPCLALSFTFLIWLVWFGN